jgi:hypothetical protein
MKTSQGLIELLLRLGVQQDNYIIMIQTADLINAGYGNLTSGNATYTFVNKSWLKASDE